MTPLPDKRQRRRSVGLSLGAVTVALSLLGGGCAGWLWTLEGFAGVYALVFGPLNALGLALGVGALLMRSRGRLTASRWVGAVGLGLAVFAVCWEMLAVIGTLTSSN